MRRPATSPPSHVAIAAPRVIRRPTASRSCAASSRRFQRGPPPLVSATKRPPGERARAARETKPALSPGGTRYRTSIRAACENAPGGAASTSPTWNRRAAVSGSQRRARSILRGSGARPRYVPEKPARERRCASRPGPHPKSTSAPPDSRAPKTFVQGALRNRRARWARSGSVSAAAAFHRAADSPLPSARRPSAVVPMCLSIGARRLQVRAPPNPPPPFRGPFEAPRTGASPCSRSRGSSFSTSGPPSPSTCCRSRAPRRGARRRLPISHATTRAGTSASPATGTARLRPRGRNRRMRSSRSTRCSRGASTFSRGSTPCGHSRPFRGSRSSSRCLFSERGAERARDPLPFLLLYPRAFFFAAAYTESLFFLPPLLAFRLIRTEHPLAAILVGLLLGLTRAPAAAVGPALALAYVLPPNARKTL